MLSTLLRSTTILCFLLAITTSLFAQNITGKVLNKETQNPIVGANVYIQDSNKGTVTGTGGSFSLEVSDDSEILTISYVG